MARANSATALSSAPRKSRISYISAASRVSHPAPPRLITRGAIAKSSALPAVSTNSRWAPSSPAAHARAYAKSDTGLRSAASRSQPEAMRSSSASVRIACTSRCKRTFTGLPAIAKSISDSAGITGVLPEVGHTSRPCCGSCFAPRSAPRPRAAPAGPSAARLRDRPAAP